MDPELQVMNTDQKVFLLYRQDCWAAFVRTVCTYSVVALKHPNKSSALKKTKIKGTTAVEAKKWTY